MKVKRLKKFPCKLIELCVRYNNQPKYSRSIFYSFNKKDKLYMTSDGNLIFSDIKLKNNANIELTNFRIEPIFLKYVAYKRTSNDYKNELFIHNYNGSEKFYSCNFKNNLIYYVIGYKDLWEKVSE